MRLGRDLAAGLGYSICSITVGLATVPFYIHYLGVEAYGLIGFHAALQGMLQLLDLGLAPAISRNVARGAVEGTMAKTRSLLRSMEFVYWATAALIGFIFIAGAPIIASRWLDANTIGTALVAEAVLLMGVLIAFRWPSGLYQGALMGAHRLTTASIIGTVWIVAANIGAVAVLAFWSPTIKAFFLWQAGVGLLYTLAMQRAAWLAVGGSSKTEFDFASLKSIWRFSAGVSGVAFTGIVFTQLDKIVLSKLLSLTDFGYYMLATLVAGMLYRIIMPIFNVAYPRFSTIVAGGDEQQLSALYRMSTNLFAIMWFPGAMILAVCAGPIVLLWTGDAEIAARTQPLLFLLGIGSALHGVMYFPYALQLAYGMTRLPLQINGLLMVIQLPLILLLATKYGAVGAAAAWLILHILYVGVGTWLTHRRILTRIGAQWLMFDIGVPLAITIMLGIAVSVIISGSQPSPVLQLLVGGAFAAFGMLLSFALSPYKFAKIRAAFAT